MRTLADIKSTTLPPLLLTFTTACVPMSITTQVTNIDSIYATCIQITLPLNPAQNGSASTSKHFQVNMYLYPSFYPAIVDLPYLQLHRQTTRPILKLNSTKRDHSRGINWALTRSSSSRNGFPMHSLLSPSPYQIRPLLKQHVRSNNVHQPETVCLSTASLPSGRVSARIVYLKELDDKGFVIYSNFDTSKKSKDLESNKWASLTFWWREQERQVRVEGITERLSPEESQVYFDTRIRGSRIGAWASKQSQVLEGREELEGWVKDVESKFEGQEKIPVPEFWGGLRIRPEMVEFWQGRDSRLHDRFQYTKVEGEGGPWKIDRLSP